MKFSSNEILVEILVFILHIVGVIGYLIDPLREYFIMLTPFNLLLLGVVVCYLHFSKDLRGEQYLIGVYLIGWFAEWVGVNFEFLFGAYFYGGSLGIKVLDIPLIIGVNWLVLAYVFASIGQKLIDNSVISLVTAAVGMVILDLMIEPVAIKYDYWQWIGGEIPIRNYIGWFVVALIVQFLLHRMDLKRNFRLSIAIILSQVTFFLLLNIF